MAKNDCKEKRDTDERALEMLRNSVASLATSSAWYQALWFHSSIAPDFPEALGVTEGRLASAPDKFPLPSVAVKHLKGQ